MSAISTSDPGLFQPPGYINSTASQFILTQQVTELYSQTVDNIGLTPTTLSLNSFIEGSNTSLFTINQDNQLTCNLDGQYQIELNVPFGVTLDNPPGSATPSVEFNITIYEQGSIVKNYLCIVPVVSSSGGSGSQGPTGPQGASGAQGAQGASGASGAQGAQGDTGASGAQGVQGDTGASGAQGAQGAQGASGAQGAQGAQGAVGAPGDTGAQGAQGASGSTTSISQASASVSCDASGNVVIATGGEGKTTTINNGIVVSATGSIDTLAVTGNLNIDPACNISVGGGTGAGGQVIGIPVGANYATWINPVAVPIVVSPQTIDLTNPPLTIVVETQNINTYYVIQTINSGVGLVAFNLSNFPVNGTFYIKNVDPALNNITVQYFTGTNSPVQAQGFNSVLYIASGANTQFCVCYWDGTTLFVY